MAIILAVGIAVIPSLYAWFNIFANWDPYGSTGNMQMAVIIEDEGYIFKDIEINVGAEIESNLKANDLIDWQFVGKKEALNGIKAGKYYAAVEIPKGFSESLTSIVTSDFKQPQIKYYANEKKNAIATKITDKVVQTIQQEVNESFVTTVINVVSSLMDVVAEATENGAVDSFSGLESKLRSASDSISSVQKTVDSFGSLVEAADSLSGIIDSEKLKELAQATEELTKDGKDLTVVIKDSVDSLTSTVDKTLDTVGDGLADAAQVIDTAAKSEKIDDVKEKLARVRVKLTKYLTLLETLRNTLDTIQQFLPKPLRALDRLINKNNQKIEKLNNIISLIEKAESKPVSSDLKAIAAKINAVNSEIDTMQTDYKNDVQPVVNNTLTSLINTLDVTGSLIADLSGNAPDLQAAEKSLESTAKSGDDLVRAINKLLNGIKGELNELADKIEGLGDSEMFNTLKNLASTNSEKMGEFLACPVLVDTDKVYGIENYGSAMAPFYTTLAIWVGSMILIAVLKTNVKKKKEIGPNVKMHEAYFGRMITFVLFAITQGLIICAGDLYFLKIQCYHPAKFLLAGVFAAFVFSIFIYSLTYTFGDIGKSIGIIMLVVQIGGSGGTFPIDVCPSFFRALHPYLPFTFLVNAMRECVCGTYSNDYWIDLLKLSAYIGVALVIGLGVKFMVKKPIRFFEKQVEKTDLF